MGSPEEGWEEDEPRWRDREEGLEEDESRWREEEGGLKDEFQWSGEGGEEVVD